MKRARAPNPFAITDAPITGMAPGHDLRPFRFFAIPRHSRAIIQNWPLWEKLVLDAYARQPRNGWVPLTERNFEVGAVLEALSDQRLPPTGDLMTSLGVALGVYDYARRQLVATDAVLHQAWSEVVGPRKTVAQLAEAVGTTVPTLARWRAMRGYKQRLQLAKAAFRQPGGFKAGPGGFRYVGDEWMDPKGESGWEAQVERVSQQLIYLAKTRRTRHPSADVRQAAYSMTSWHMQHRRVMSPRAVKAVAYALGQVDAFGARVLARDERKRGKEFSDLVWLVAMAKQAGEQVPPVKHLQFATGQPRSVVEGWLRDPEFVSMVERISVVKSDS